MYLPLLYVVSGTLNVLLLKWSNILQGECSDGKWRHFNHPVVLTALMFLGEILCFIVYKVVFCILKCRRDDSENVNLITRGGREFSAFSMLLPSLLDAIASVMLFTGLYLTYASSFQMLRGVALVFVGLFGYMHLNQALTIRHWIAMFIISCGTFIIVLVDTQRAAYDNASLESTDANAILTGNLLIICAQVFHAAQYVYEEKHLQSVDTPAMLAIGWQGIFGLGITIIFGVCMHFLPAQMPFSNNSRGVFDDLSDLLPQLKSNPTLLTPLIIFVISCACYNYAALSIVKYSSAANRILADGLRVIIIWTGALFLEWEYFVFTAVLGYIILEMGIISYRNAIFLEWYRSLLTRMQRRGFVIVSVDSAASGTPASRPADII